MSAHSSLTSRDKLYQALIGVQAGTSPESRPPASASDLIVPTTPIKIEERNRSRMSLRRLPSLLPRSSPQGTTRERDQPIPLLQLSQFFELLSLCNARECASGEYGLLPLQMMAVPRSHWTSLCTLLERRFFPDVREFPSETGVHLGTSLVMWSCGV